MAKAGGLSGMGRASSQSPCMWCRKHTVNPGALSDTGQGEGVGSMNVAAAWVQPAWCAVCALKPLAFELSPVDHEPPEATTGKARIRKEEGLSERWGSDKVNQGL